MGSPATSPEQHSGEPSRSTPDPYSPLSIAPASRQEIEEEGTRALVIVAEKDGALTTEQKKILQSFVQDLTKGALSAAPMICQGSDCPMLSACPIHRAEAQLPIGRPCPVEKTAVQVWVNKHLEALDIKDPLASDSSFDMDLLYELAHQELIKWRATVHLSDEPAMVKEVQVGGTPQGVPIFAQVIHPALEIMEKAGKRVEKIREALIATRKSQVMAGQQMGDPSSKAADLVGRARKKIADRRRQQEEEIKDAEVEIREE